MKIFIYKCVIFTIPKILFLMKNDFSKVYLQPSVVKI